MDRISGRKGGRGENVLSGTRAVCQIEVENDLLFVGSPYVCKSLCQWEAAAWELDGGGVMLPKPHTALLSPGFQERLVGRSRLSPPPKQGSVPEDSSTYSFLLSWFCLQLKLFCGLPPYPSATF